MNTASKSRLAFSATTIVFCLTACKLLVHLYAGRHYGYFVDELYYLACSRRLDWGYDQGFAGLATLVAPGILAGDNLLTMNAFEPLFWMGCAWLLMRMVQKVATLVIPTPCRTGISTSSIAGASGSP